MTTWTQAVPRREGADAYIVAIRDPERDPPRRTREERKGKETEWQQLRRAPAIALRGPILGLLKARGPLTFNAIAVLMFDQTADVALGGPLEEALWSLLADELVARTDHAPIYWRAQGGKAAPQLALL